MKKYLLDSQFYSKLFPVDPDFKRVRLLKMVVEDVHAYMTVGLVNVLPSTAPGSWNKSNLDSTKIILSFEFLEYVSIGKLVQGEIGCLCLDECQDLDKRVRYLTDKVQIELKCKFVSINGVLPYSELNCFNHER